MAQSKSVCEMYRISHEGEYATICVATWANEKNGQSPSFGGEILVHSSFGAFCNTWSNCAAPFKQFLLDIRFDSFMQKCLGNDFKVFDGDASIEQVKRAFLRLRRARAIDADKAEEFWGDLEGFADVASSSEESFYRELYDFCENLDGMGEPGDYVVHSPSQQATGFWQQLWPIFKTMLESELTAAPLLEEN